MTLFHHKVDDRRGLIVQSLLSTPSEERRFILMSVFQTGELKLSEADEVIRLVRRLEQQAGIEASCPGPADLLPVRPA